MASPATVSQIDRVLGDLLKDWNFASTVLVGLIAIVIVYPIFSAKEPDTHPFLLARQAQSAPIRQPGESAVLRSTDIPYGYPLRSGLAIKDPGASKWTTGRDGDLRDVWRQAVNGSKKEDGSVASPPGKVTTILGTEKVIEHDIKNLVLDVNVIGKFLKEAGARKVAVSLSNSVELICSVFAGSFYNFSPILFPYNQNPASTKNLLGTIAFDTLIAEAGSVALEALLKHNKSVKRIIWVTKVGSQHLDWNEVPEGAGGKIDVLTWHDLVEEHQSNSSNEVPPLDTDNEALSVFAFWPDKNENYQLVEYTQKNLVAGIGALQSSLPRTHKLSPADVILPTTPLTTSYTLCWSLLTLFTGASLVLNSVAGSNVNVLAVTKSARQKIQPTHVIVDARATPRFTEDLTALAAKNGLSATYSAWKNSRAIMQGYMADSKPAWLPNQLSQLKVLCIDQPDIVQHKGRIASEKLAGLRLLLCTRVALALTTGRVAGYVAQTNLLDYRDKEDVCCVGAVASSIELNLAGDEGEMKKEDAQGTVVVKGPAVVGKEKEKVVLEAVRARIDGDNTIIVV